MNTREAIAARILELCKERKFEFLRMEGYQTGLWILVDLNDVIVHIMQEAERDLYHLESLWRDAERLPDMLPGTVSAPSAVSSAS